MPSRNCAKNLHACQWERDIFLVLAIVFLMLNVAQVTYTHRAKLFRFLRRGAQRIPEGLEDDEHPIIGIRD